MATQNSWDLLLHQHRENGWQFADDILKCILLTKQSSILIQILLKFILNSPTEK